MLSMQPFYLQKIIIFYIIDNVYDVVFKERHRIHIIVCTSLWTPGVITSWPFTIGQKLRGTGL